MFEHKFYTRAMRFWHDSAIWNCFHQDCCHWMSRIVWIIHLLGTQQLRYCQSLLDHSLHNWGNDRLKHGPWSKRWACKGLDTSEVRRSTLTWTISVTNQFLRGPTVTVLRQANGVCLWCFLKPWRRGTPCRSSPLLRQPEDDQLAQCLPPRAALRSFCDTKRAQSWQFFVNLWRFDGIWVTLKSWVSRSRSLWIFAAAFGVSERTCECTISTKKLIPWCLILLRYACDTFARGDVLAGLKPWKPKRYEILLSSTPTQ